MFDLHSPSQNRRSIHQPDIGKINILRSRVSSASENYTVVLSALKQISEFIELQFWKWKKVVIIVLLTNIYKQEI